MVKTQKGFISRIIDSFFELATIEISTVLALILTLFVVSINISLFVKVPILVLVGAVYMIKIIRVVRK